MNPLGNHPSTHARPHHDHTDHDSRAGSTNASKKAGAGGGGGSSGGGAGGGGGGGDGGAARGKAETGSIILGGGDASGTGFVVDDIIDDEGEYDVEEDDEFLQVHGGRISGRSAYVWVLVWVCGCACVDVGVKYRSGACVRVFTCMHALLCARAYKCAVRVIQDVCHGKTKVEAESFTIRDGRK